MLKHASENIQFPTIDKTMNEALERIRTNDVNPELLSEQVKDMISQEEIDCQIASGIVKGVEKVLKNVFAQGESVGIAKGEARGKLAGILETAKNFLSLGFPIEKVQEATGLSLKELEVLR